MAKNTEAEVEVEGDEAETPKVDKRGIWVEHPTYTNGEKVKRAEWIRNVYSDASNEQFYGKRAAIAKALSEMQGKDVPYQIVFAATRDNPAPAQEIKAAKAAAKAEAAEEAAIAKAEKAAAKAEADAAADAE